MDHTDSLDRMISRANSMMRTLRMKDKALENSKKPPLCSPDVRFTGDFVFSKICPQDCIGDSGQLLLAKEKADRTHRYLVKHEYTDCAANEFVYTKLARAMGFKMPSAVLFQLSDGEKRRYFKTEYILGTDFLNLTLLDPTFQQIREQAYNWKDYFHFLAMYSMCVECDSFEVPIADDHYLYRVDTTASFLLSNAMLEQAGINEQIGDYIPKEVLQKHVEHIAYERSWRDHVFHKQLEKLIQIHGEDCRQPYLETFSLIQGIPGDYIDDFLNTLCYFYPDFIGDYFKRFITALQKESAAFLKEETGRAV